MRPSSPDPENAQAVARARAELDRLSAAAIDASSMIYLLKAGFLGYVAAEVSLYTVGPVAQEVGWPELPVKIADLRRGGDVRWTRDTIEIAETFVDAGPGAGRGNGARPGAGSGAGSGTGFGAGAGAADLGTNDELLLRLAAARDLPVMSEDRELLARAQEHGLSYFNALMALALVFIRDRIGEDEYEEFFELLRGLGHYGRDVLAFSRAVAAVSRPDSRRS